MRACVEREITSTRQDSSQHVRLRCIGITRGVAPLQEPSRQSSAATTLRSGIGLVNVSIAQGSKLICIWMSLISGSLNIIYNGAIPTAIHRPPSNLFHTRSVVAAVRHLLGGEHSSIVHWTSISPRRGSGFARLRQYTGPEGIPTGLIEDKTQRHLSASSRFVPFH